MENFINLDFPESLFEAEEAEYEPLEHACRLIRSSNYNEAIKVIDCHKDEATYWVNSYGNHLSYVAAWNGATIVLDYLKKISAFMDSDSLSVVGARHLRVLEWLQKHKLLDANAQCEGGTTPLQQSCNCTTQMGLLVDHEAVQERLQCMRFLLEHGADIDTVNDDGRTAIMGAAFIGAELFVQYFLEMGASVSPHIRCVKDKSAIDYASTPGVETLIRRNLLGRT